jgi:hypothetical protein
MATSEVVKSLGTAVPSPSPRWAGRASHAGRLAVELRDVGCTRPIGLELDATVPWPPTDVGTPESWPISDWGSSAPSSEPPSPSKLAERPSSAARINCARPTELVVRCFVIGASSPSSAEYACSAGRVALMPRPTRSARCAEIACRTSHGSCYVVIVWRVLAPTLQLTDSPNMNPQLWLETPAQLPQNPRSQCLRRTLGSRAGL